MSNKFIDHLTGFFPGVKHRRWEAKRQAKAERNAFDEQQLEKVKGWIASNAQGKTFADVGGIGLAAANERVTLAVKSGAASATMIDIRPADFHEWTAFHARCRDEEIENYGCVDRADVTDPGFPEQAGTYDFVHCTGIVYHLPDPVFGVWNLLRTAKDLLILNTVVIPGKIQNEKGVVRYKGSSAVFLPGLSETERAVLDFHFRKNIGLSLDFIASRIDDPKQECPWFENGRATCWPYWWLFTERSFTALVRMMGFEILETSLWRKHALALLARRIGEPGAPVRSS